MKYTLSLAIVFVILFNIAIAQKMGVRTGAMIGAPIPTIVDSGATGNPIIAYNIGFCGEAFRKKWFAVSTGINYERQFSSYSSLIDRTDTSLIQNVLGIPTMVNTYFRGEVNGRMNLHYLTIPAEVVIYPLKHLRIQVGTYAASLIAGQDTGLAHLVIGNNFTTSNNRYNNFPEMRKLDLGASGGIGFDFPFGLFIDLRLSRSFRVLLQEDFFYSNNQKVSKMYNTRASLGIGYFFYNRNNTANKEDRAG